MLFKPECCTGDWRVQAPDFSLTTDKSEIAARAKWDQLVAETAIADKVTPCNLTRVAYMEHVESDTQVWFLRCLATKQV